MAKPRKTKRANNSLGDLGDAKTPYSVVGNDLNRAQELTAFPTLKVIGYVRYASENVSDYSEFHMTIRTKITDLAPKATSMLLAVAC
jgi:hypothetical protein